MPCRRAGALCLLPLCRSISQGRDHGPRGQAELVSRACANWQLGLLHPGDSLMLRPQPGFGTRSIFLMTQLGRVSAGPQPPEAGWASVPPINPTAAPAGRCATSSTSPSPSVTRGCGREVVSEPRLACRAGPGPGPTHSGGRRCPHCCHHLSHSGTRCEGGSPWAVGKQTCPGNRPPVPQTPRPLRASRGHLGHPTWGHTPFESGRNDLALPHPPQEPGTHMKRALVGKRLLCHLMP